MDSLDEAISFLEQIQEEQSFVTQRQMLENYHFNSPIINSHITYDSIVTVECERLALQSIEEADEDDEMTFYYAFLDNSSNLSVYQAEWDGETVMVAEPIGDLDIYALFNEDGIFVIDRLLFKLLSDSNVIVCDAFQYEEFAEAQYIQMLYDNPELTYTEADVRMTSEDSIKWSIFDGPALYEIFDSNEDTQRRTANNRCYYNVGYYEAYGTTNNGKYKMTLKLNYHFYWHWITGRGTDLHTHLYLKNYKRGNFLYCLSKLPTSGSVNFEISYNVNPIYLFSTYSDIQYQYYHPLYEINSTFWYKEYTKRGSTGIWFWASQISNRQSVITNARLDNGRVILEIYNNVQQ